MKVHQRGVDLLLDLQDALQHIEKLSSNEIQELLVEMEIVLRDLLARDAPLDKDEAS